MTEWSSLLGGFSGLATAFLWACSATAWGLAGRRIGAMAVNLSRITLAAVILAIIHAAAYGTFLPALSHRTWTLLVVSGAIGVGIGDLCYFRSVIILGPRLGTLLLALSPVIATLMSYAPPLREHLGAQAIIGIFMTVAGVAWVVSEPRGKSAWQTPKDASFTQGVLLGVVSSLTASFGMVLSHLAFIPQSGEPAIDAFPAGMVRVWTGMVVTFALAIVGGRMRSIGKGLMDRSAMLIVVVGTLVGPVVGIWMSMLALKLNPAGVGVALINTSPIMMVPLALIFYRERPTARAVAGAVLTVAGVFVLMLR